MLDRGFLSSYAGVPAEVACVRHEVWSYLADSPVADDVALVVSELASNAIMHSNSAGGIFTVRVDRRDDHIYIEVQDDGGPWVRLIDESRLHGLDILTLLAPHWGVMGTDTCRVVWARVPCS